MGYNLKFCIFFFFFGNTVGYFPRISLIIHNKTIYKITKLNPSNDWISINITYNLSICLLNHYTVLIIGTGTLLVLLLFIGPSCC